MAMTLGSPALPDLSARILEDPSEKLWALETRSSSYVLRVDGNGVLRNLFWGARLGGGDYADAAFAAGSEEYPGWGGPVFVEAGLKLTRADGVRDVVLRYHSHRQPDPDRLVIRLKDCNEEIFVNLHYRVFEDYDLLGKRVAVENRTSQSITLESAQSGVWRLPPADSYRLTHLAGHWGAELRLAQQPIQPGMIVLDSRRGKTSHRANPWFAIDEGGRADEDRGEVWFGALAWSGNWKLAVERTDAGDVRVVGGMNTFDFAYPLAPGESLETPHFYGGYTSGGFGQASRNLHRFTRNEVLPDRASPQLRPVVYNSWYSVYFDVNESLLKRVADRAAPLGVEVFAIDDGWFGERNDDTAGLGDWHTNPEKFPNGLGPVIEHVNNLGMKFGIWIEPEMVNPDSDLYRSHPDWVINFPGRPRSESRNQLVLNIAREDVKEHLFQTFDKLFSDHKIEYVKWDMNRDITEPGWPGVAPEAQRTLWVEYVRSLYELLDRLRESHPDILFETCSGGGGRVDLGIIARSGQIWTSDNTDPLDRLKLQHGFSLPYPPKIMMSWVTDVPDSHNGRTTSLKYRFLVSMMGSLGLSVALEKWPEEDLDYAQEMIALYKEIRETVQHGDLYRLASPWQGETTANQYVAEGGGQSVLFVFRHSQQFRERIPPIRLMGLDPNASYLLRPIDDKLSGGARAVSGAYLAAHGLALDLVGDFDATAVVIDRAN